MNLLCCKKCKHLDYSDSEYENGHLVWHLEMRRAVCNLADRRDICKIVYTKKKEKQQTINGAFKVPDECPYFLEHLVSERLRPDYYSKKTYPTYL